MWLRTAAAARGSAGGVGRDSRPRQARYLSRTAQRRIEAALLYAVLSGVFVVSSRGPSSTPRR
jgi:hypothetical protein